MCPSSCTSFAFCFGYMELWLWDDVLPPNPARMNADISKTVADAILCMGFFYW